MRQVGLLQRQHRSGVDAVHRADAVRVGHGADARGLDAGSGGRRDSCGDRAAHSRQRVQEDRLHAQHVRDGKRLTIDFGCAHSGAKFPLHSQDNTD
eukprot:1418332-Rhodomonas_salina.2